MYFNIYYKFANKSYLRYNKHGDNMNEAKKLTIQMSIFFLIIFVTLGTIIIKEKSTILFLPKIENSLNTYIKENYNDIEFEKSKVTYKNNTYSIKLMNKENNNLYFYITYSNKKITDTYQDDYVEGKSLITHLNSKIENIILNKIDKTYKVSINNTYNNFSDKVQEKLIKEENLESLKIYTLETNITTTWDTTSITNEITTLITNLEENNITPKNYTITITDSSDITQSVKITNLTKNDNLNLIISDIINNEKTSILDENNITYEYLN